jgi:hypothetical protein
VRPFSPASAARGPKLQEPNKNRKRGPRLIDRIALRFASAEYVDSLWIGATDSGGKHEHEARALERLREALSLIKTYDRVRYNRILRDLKRVWSLAVQYSGGGFNARLDACILHPRVVLAENTPTEILASMIVHEATHARLWRYGIGYPEALRPRIEAICVRRELAFSARLPNGKQVRRWAEDKLQSHCSLAALSDAALAKSRNDQIVENLRATRMPNWAITAFFALRSGLKPKPACR